MVAEWSSTKSLNLPQENSPSKGGNEPLDVRAPMAPQSAKIAKKHDNLHKCVETNCQCRWTCSLFSRNQVNAYIEGKSVKNDL